MKHPYFLLMTLIMAFCKTGFGQCSGGSSFSSVAAPSGASAVTISSCNWSGDYNTVTGVVLGNTYTLTSSPAACITIHSGSPTGPVVTFGTSSVSFTAASAGTYYMTLNANCSGCGTGTTCLTTTIQCTSCATPLAVEFIELTGAYSSGLNMLQWDFSGESSPGEFVIERSENGIQYTEIGTINPQKLGPGTSSFQFVDVPPVLSDLSYYRISLVHKNGNVTFSNTLVLEKQLTGDNALLEAFPNPVTDDLEIVLSSKSQTTYQLTLSDLNGRKIWNSNQQTQKGLTYTTIDMSELESGCYFLTATLNGRELSTQKIVKE